MPEISDNDFEYLFKIASAYHSLVGSAVNPIAISSGIENQRFSKIYYDCEDRGRGIMKKRLELAEQDIVEYHAAHKILIKDFYDIDEAINRNNRKDIDFCVDKAFEGIIVLAETTRDHRERLKDKAFLDYPYCIPEHYFHIARNPKISTLEFNETRDFEGIGLEYDLIKELKTDFLIGKDNLSGARIFPRDSGEGIIESTLRARVELNKLLLERVGLTISGT